MRLSPRIGAALVAAMVSQAQAEPWQTGLADLRVDDRQGQRILEGFTWYPTNETSGLSRFHGNAVWVGIEAIGDAEPASGKFPLVVLSHGMYGNAMNQSWLASELAKRGFVVAAANHPGTATRARDADDARQLWERPKDVSRMIDNFLRTPEWRAHVDPERIYMAGHSLGGFTAIALAGGRFDALKFDGFCARHPGDRGCRIVDNWRVTETPEDRAQMEADLSEPRIRGFAVFDPGGTQTFSAASLGSIRRPMLVFGAPRDIDRTGLDLDMESRALTAALPAGNVKYLEPETLAHFDFLGECTPRAIDILKEEEPEDVFVCIEGGGDRRAEHRMIVNEVARFFSAP